ncbi:hypothetical protein BTVI_103348 [Pitangus sulphuratus]|nr:hypothetical protein BTVI_103348 [Pitangus sulphuratus]
MVRNTTDLTEQRVLAGNQENKESLRLLKEGVDNNFPDIETALAAHLDSAKIPKARRKRYISQNDMIAILDYHNQVRGKVFPPASNMEYMVWDETLAKSAEAWAATCIWDHGPSYLLRFLGQNLSVRTGRYRSILQLVKPWYDEVKDYAFPYPQDCNPRCPMRCYGPMCTHYTQHEFNIRASQCGPRIVQPKSVFQRFMVDNTAFDADNSPLSQPEVLLSSLIGSALASGKKSILEPSGIGSTRQGKLLEASNRSHPCSTPSSPCYQNPATETYYSYFQSEFTVYTRVNQYQVLVEEDGFWHVSISLCIFPPMLFELSHKDGTRGSNLAHQTQFVTNSLLSIKDMNMYLYFDGFPNDGQTAILTHPDYHVWLVEEKEKTVEGSHKKFDPTQAVSAMILPNATLLEELLEKYMDEDGEWWIAKQRGKRAITDSDMQSILDLHNKLRGQVYPPASNMEYMLVVLGEMKFYVSPHLNGGGQVSGASLVPVSLLVCRIVEKFRISKGEWSWEKSSGTSPDLHDLSKMIVSSLTVVCAVSLSTCGCIPSGHTDFWMSEGSERPYSPHEPEEETNEIERQRSKAQDATGQSRPRTHSPSASTGTDDSEKNEVISTQQMSQIVSCEVRLRDQCKGTTCNRYECPAGCLDSKAKVIGSVHYEMQSSICKAAIHYGILDNEGGWVDVTRQGRKNYFIKSYRNGIQSIGKYQSANSFTVSKVTVQAITCETTVEQLCPFQKPASHCPRVYCPHNCMQANPHYARVIGTRIYSDISSICRAALHAGVVRNQGGYVDVMPVDKRKVYVASFQNGIYSERIETKVQVEFDCDGSPKA